MSLSAHGILLLVITFGFIEGLPDVIRIGGLFDIGDVKQEVAFRYAIGKVNERLTSARYVHSRLEPMIERIPPFDSFQASKKVCQILNTGVAAIFGPQSGQTSAHVQSICDALEVPHVETRWDYRLRRDDYSVNLYPHPSSLSKAYLDLVRLFNWKSFCILYEDNEGLIRLQELLKSPSPKEFKIKIRQLPAGNDFRGVLKEIKREGENNIILDCSTDKVGEVLKQAQQISMMSPYNNFIVTSLDLHLLNLEDFKYSGSNITAVRLIDPTSPKVSEVMKEIRSGTQRHTKTQYQHDMARGTETALMFDAVHLFAKAISATDDSTNLEIRPLMCDGEDAWSRGNSVINYMKMVNMTGLTGLIEFDSLGFRTNFELDIIELDLRGFEKVGTWSLRYRTNYTKSANSTIKRIEQGLRNKTLVVTFAFNDPYIMHRESTSQLIGNDRYEGFCVDLLEEISKALGFNYTLIPIENNAYGSKDPVTNEWTNGMIKELIDRKADMAITDLTINYERESAVDFTMPFMNLGITIIYKKPEKTAPSLFSFLSPLSLEVWIYMMSAYIGVAVLLYILARFTPYEWQNPHPCNPEPDTLENQFTILNCLWFAIGSLMQQGCDFLPQAMSTRMVAGMWWFFTLIMISSYTANLAAFLTVERMESPIESAEDLAKQTKIKYGFMKSGSTRSFFRDSQIPTYYKMYKFVMNDPENLIVSSNREGYEKVKNSNGGYAFLTESPSIEYITERECDLIQVGGLLDSKSYGIALQPGSSYKDTLDVEILRLQQGGRLYELKQKWWKERRGGGKCKEEGSSGIANELSLDNVGGVFVVLLGGMGLALIVAMFEFVSDCRTSAAKEERPFIEVLREELQFVFKCKGSVKPIKKSAKDDEERSTVYGEGLYNFSGKSPLS